MHPTIFEIKMESLDSVKDILVTHVRQGWTSNEVRIVLLLISFPFLAPVVVSGKQV